MSGGAVGGATGISGASGRLAGDTAAAAGGAAAASLPATDGAALRDGASASGPADGTAALYGGIRVQVLATAAEAERHVAGLLAGQVRQRPDSVLGLATGGTPVGVYRELAALYRAGDADWSRARTFNLDEYAGLSPDHPQSYAAYMREHLFARINLVPERTHLPDGAAADAEEACRRYDALYDTWGPADLQLLGIGLNGHIGFNEPDFAPAPGGTQVVRLAESTRRANARFFGAGETVPEAALTMSVGRILQARAIVLLATGAAKADIVARALEGPIGTACPASLLQLHPAATFVLDAAAAGRLALQPAAAEACEPPPERG